MRAAPTIGSPDLQTHAETHPGGRRTRSITALTVALTLLAVTACEPLDPACDGGCVGADRRGPPPGPSGRFSGHPSCDVIAPPPALGLGAIYVSYINCTGVPVVATAGVSPEAVTIADATLEFMLTGNDAIRSRMIAGGEYYILRGDDVAISDLPEPFRGVLNQHGGNNTPDAHVATSRGTEVECRPGSEFFGANTLVHEFAHQMHTGGVPFESETNAEIMASYAAARSAGLWDNTYAATNYLEYFAEMVGIWFEVNRPEGPVGGDGLANEVNTRDELLAYDPRVHALLASMFNPSFDVPGCIHRTVVTPFVDPNLDCGATVSDADGNTYPMVQIGEQCWMATNLTAATFRDGSPIAERSDDLDWEAGAASAAQSVYENAVAPEAGDGRLYNHAAARAPEGLCPEGLRLPTVDDVIQLIGFVGGGDGQVAVARLRAVNAWEDAPASDDHDFAARPTGVREASGGFGGRLSRWQMWTADMGAEDPSRASSYAIFGNLEDVQQRAEDPGMGLSVRCMRP